MIDALPTEYGERAAFIRDRLAPLPRRRRLAVAVAALERCFEVIADCPLDVTPAETVWELARLAAHGEAIPLDEAQWAMQEVDDAEDDTAHDLNGVEHAVTRLVWFLADAVRDPEGDLESVAAVLEALLDGVDAATSDDHDDDDRREFAWIAALLAGAGPPTNVEIDAAIVARGRSGAPRWVVRVGTGVGYRDPDPTDLEERTQTLISARPAAAAARATRVAARRRATPIVPFRAAHGIPERYAVREVGRGADADEGKIAVSGARHYGLFSSDDDDAAGPLFAPPESVALGMTADEATLVSWRVTRRAGVSGIARGHYQWTLEVYRWPAATLIASHVVAAQEVIDWCTPVDLAIPARDDGTLVVVMRATSEDFRRHVELVRGEDGRFTETVT